MCNSSNYLENVRQTSDNCHQLVLYSRAQLHLQHHSQTADGVFRNVPPLVRNLRITTPLADSLAQRFHDTVPPKLCPLSFSLAYLLS